MVPTSPVFTSDWKKSVCSFESEVPAVFRAVHTEGARLAAVRAARLSLGAARGPLACLKKIAGLVAVVRAWTLSPTFNGVRITSLRSNSEEPHRAHNFSSDANTAPAVVALAAATGGIAVRSSDSWTRKSLVAAIVTAFLLHAVAFLLFVIELPKKDMGSEPPAMPVELVMVPPPKAAAPPSRQQPVLEPSKRESGGASDRAAGQAPDMAPEPNEVPEPVEALEPVVPPIPSAPPTSVTTPVPSLPKPRPTPAALPHIRRPPAPLHNDSAIAGEGGGDRYLNAMRDRIMSELVYPDAAHSLRLYGVAIYEVLLDRRGQLVAVEMRLSSGEGILDAAGINAIQHSAPFGPVPADVPGERIGVEIRLPMQP